MKKAISLFLAFVMVLAILSTSAFAAENEPEYIFKFANTAPAQGVQADGFNKFKELVEEYSDGRIRVDVYFAGSLAEKVGSLEGLQLGTIEVTELAATDLSAYNPIWDVFGLPYFFEYPLQAIKIACDPEIDAILEADAEENGFKILGWITYGARNVFNTKHEINTIDDMKGLKIRVMASKTLLSCMEALGASPISLAWTECYAGLEQGTIDAVENGTPLIISNGFTELGGYYSYTEHFVVPDPILISKTVFDALPEDLQDAVVRAGKDTQDFWNNTLWPECEAQGVKEMTEIGVVVTEPDLTAFREAAAASIESAVSGWNADQTALYNKFMELKAQYPEE